MNLLEIGKILRPHGIKGAVKIESYREENFSFKKVYIGKEKMEVTIKSVQHLNKDFYIITLNNIPCYNYFRRNEVLLWIILMTKKQ